MSRSLFRKYNVTGSFLSTQSALVSGALRFGFYRVWGVMQVQKMKLSLIWNSSSKTLYVLLPTRNISALNLHDQLYTSKFCFLLIYFLFCPIVWRLSLNISFKVACCSLGSFTNDITKTPWSSKRIEKTNSIHNTTYSRIELLNFLEAILKIKKFPFKSHMIKTVFFPVTQETFWSETEHSEWTRGRNRFTSVSHPPSWTSSPHMNIT